VSPDDLRAQLVELENHIRERVLRERDATRPGALSGVAAVTAADTIYAIDRISEAAILEWFAQHWPAAHPVELVMEGHEGPPAVFPGGTALDETEFKLIIDPIDGTRSLMHDKRSAWVLAAVAPQRGAATRLSDCVAAAMTELPPVKQRLADQLSGTAGCGADGLVSTRLDLDSRARTPWRPTPSRAGDVLHGFAGFSRFFPAGKGLLARVDEALWQRLYDDAAAPVFEDQYPSTGGQFYELLAGRDRLAGDLRPLAYARLGIGPEPSCHPYDACTALLLAEAGCPLSTPAGTPLDFPLDTTTPVAWVGFANPTLAAHIRPALAAVLAEVLGA
jgi:fructose-1,6-bisphosphatase/inositol monophosphatase family enzyme